MKLLNLDAIQVVGLPRRAREKAVRASHRLILPVASWANSAIGGRNGGQAEMKWTNFAQVTMIEVYTVAWLRRGNGTTALLDLDGNPAVS